MTRRVNDLELQATVLEGGILHAATIQKVQKLEAARQKPEDYDVDKGLDLRDEINRAFKILSARFGDFDKTTKSPLQVRTLAEHLFTKVLGFDLEFQTLPVLYEGREFKVAFLSGHVPIILTSPGEDTEKAGLDIPQAAFADGKRKRSAAGTLQELLNANEARMWGFAFDGHVLRLMRDNASMTRPAYIEFDIARIVNETLFAEFSILWLLCHASRFRGALDEIIIEGWKQAAKDDGVVARDRLQGNFRAMLLDLGNGLLENPRNDKLRSALRERKLDAMQFQGDLLRFAYRVIFLITIEDRDVLHPPHTEPAASELYRSGYSLARLRDKALKRAGDSRHHDLWLGLRLTLAKLSTGDAAIGLPALGGLFDGRLCFDDAVVSNRRLISAIRHLFWMQTGTGVVKVNWRDMETEEFGSVYEGLLELVPLISPESNAMNYPGDADQARAKPGAKGKKAGGNKRKTTGSYYTPDSLVQALLDSTLDPVVDQALKENDDAEAAVLDLKVIDPACGSGHFLLGAARRLAERLVRIRCEGAPTPNDWRHAMRDVVRSCIHGVDANPLAIELCKAALWLESIEPGKPLTFLDNRVKLGNSLFGVHDLTLLKGGIPDDAYAPLSGDDRKAARYYRDLNAEFFAARKKNPNQFEIDFSTGYGAIVELDRLFDRRPEETRADVEAKAAEYQALLSHEEQMRFTMAANVFSAAFFAPKTEAKTKFDRSQRSVPVSLDVFQLIKGEAGTVPASVISEAERLDKMINFFHWPLQFPAVMSRGGFDIVVGNPPWEKLKLVEKEFFATLAPQIAEAGKADRARFIKLLAASDPGSAERMLFEKFVAAKSVAEAGSNFARKSGRFPLTGQGDVNLYPLFAEHFCSIANDNSRSGLICPTGIATEKNTSVFFGKLVSDRSVASLLDFENRKSLFKGVDSRTKFCLLTIGKNQTEINFISYATSTSDLLDDDKKYQLTPNQIERVNPNTKTIPLFRTRVDAEITARIHDRVDVLIRTEGPNKWNPWKIKYARFFDMTNDAAPFFKTKQQLLSEGFVRDGVNFVVRNEGAEDRRVPLYEAKMVHHYDHRWATYEGASETEVLVDDDGNSTVELKPRDVIESEKGDLQFEPEPRYWVPAIEVERRLAAAGWRFDWLVGWRDICRATDERTVIGGFMPKVGVGNTMPIMMPEASARQISCLVGNLSALVLDFVARQKVGGTHLNYMHMSQLPLLGPDLPPSQEQFVCERVGELAASSGSMAALAKDLGVEVRRVGEDKRRMIRAELDAFFAIKYGLSKDDLRYVLDPASVKGDLYPSETFRGLKEKETARFNEFRTARLVLEAYDRLASDPMFRQKAA